MIRVQKEKVRQMDEVGPEKGEFFFGQVSFVFPKKLWEFLMLNRTLSVLGITKSKSSLAGG